MIKYEYKAVFSDLYTLFFFGGGGGLIEMNSVFYIQNLTDTLKHYF